VAVLSTTPIAGEALEEAGVSAVIPNVFDLQDLLRTVQVHTDGVFPDATVGSSRRPEPHFTGLPKEIYRSVVRLVRG
jgi:hypothetical protein